MTSLAPEPMCAGRVHMREREVVINLGNDNTDQTDMPLVLPKELKDSGFDPEIWTVFAQRLYNKLKANQVWQFPIMAARMFPPLFFITYPVAIIQRYCFRRVLDKVVKEFSKEFNDCMHWEYFPEHHEPEMIGYVLRLNKAQMPKKMKSNTKLSDTRLRVDGDSAKPKPYESRWAFGEASASNMDLNVRG